MKFRELYFGQADARTEAIRQPEGFVRSFVDHRRVVESVLDDGRFLVLGPKGAGKSALAWFLRARSGDRDLIVHPRDVSDLPIADVAKLKTGDAPGISRSLNAWRFILLCGLLDTILEDQNSDLNKNLEAMSVIAKLREYGFLDPTPKAAILKASTSTWKVPIPRVGDVFSRETTESLHLVHLIPYLEKWVTEERGSFNHYLLVLDGLDSIYLNSDEYIPALSALVQSTLSLNQALRGADATGGVVLLLRNDVFSRLDLPDGGKVRSDWGIELDWRVLSGDASAAPLFDLVDRKAISLTKDRQPIDVVREFFPAEIQLKGRGAERDVYNYLLNLTRHTPRDLLQLFENIRQVVIADPASEYSPTLRQETIREGVLQYSTKYFVDAVRNELVGRGGSGEAGRAVVDALRNLRSRRFTRDEYKASLERLDAEGRPAADDALRWLFFAGAIGNEVGNQGQRYLQFFHRRDDNDVYLPGTLVIHNALVYAWAVPWN